MKCLGDRSVCEAHKEELRKLAIYCFMRHGNDAYLYNALADLAGMMPSASEQSAEKREQA